MLCSLAKIHKVGQAGSAHRTTHGWRYCCDGATLAGGYELRCLFILLVGEKERERKLRYRCIIHSILALAFRSHVHYLQLFATLYSFHSYLPAFFAITSVQREGKVMQVWFVLPRVLSITVLVIWYTYFTCNARLFTICIGM